MLSFVSKRALFSLLILPAILLASQKVTQTKIDPDIAKREQMIVVARQLGVDCVYCHNLKNLKSDEKKTFKVAKKHGEIVTFLNTNTFTGSAKIDCYICHRGQAKPEFSEPKGL